MNKLVTNNVRMNVTSSPITIQDKELRDLIFEVPLYQREYSWELDQISDLFYDIDVSDIDEGHFLGSILLHSISDNTRQIIDGQQRLTTIFLLLYSIRKALNSIEEKDEMVKDGISTIDPIIYQKRKRVSDTTTSIEPRLITGNRDRKLFKAILQNQELKGKQDKRRRSHKLLLNALDNFIDPKIKQILITHGSEKLCVFLDKVVACQYIVMTAEKLEDQRLLFKTLNSRGLELSESDLIKNEVCKNITSESVIQEAIDIWDEMRDTLERNNSNVDLFLFHFINSLHEAQKISFSINLKKQVDTSKAEEKKDYPPIPEKLVFAAYEYKIKNVNTLNFLEDLKYAASLYVDISNPVPNKFSKGDKSFLYLQGLKSLNITKCYPLLLRGRHILNQKNFERLTQAIEALSFRHSITKREPKDLEKFYYTLLDMLKSDNDIDNIINSIRQNPTMKEEEIFKKNFIDAAPKANVGKMIIQRLIKETQEPVDFNQKNVWFEHIMPQTPSGAWNVLYNSDKDLYENLVHSLGNLTYLLDVKNMGASNKDFNLKKELYYSKSLIQMTNELTKYDNWNKESIEKRQLALFEIAKNIWKV